MELEERINLLKKLRERACVNAGLNKDNAESKQYYLAISSAYDLAFLLLTNDKLAESMSNILNEEK